MVPCYNCGNPLQNINIYIPLKTFKLLSWYHLDILVKQLLDVKRLHLHKTLFNKIILPSRMISSLSLKKIETSMFTLLSSLFPHNNQHRRPTKVVNSIILTIKSSFCISSEAHIVFWNIWQLGWFYFLPSHILFLESILAS